MLLKTRKTFSQQQLATELRMPSVKQPRIFTWERRRLLIHAAKTALAAVLCWAIALHLGLQDGYWGVITVIIVLQSNVGSTVTASRDRVLGTIIGALCGFGFSLFGVMPWNFVLALLASTILCGLLGFKNSSRLAGVTVTIVMVVQKSGSHWTVPLNRVIEVLLGIVVALAVSTLILPDRARIQLREGLAQELLLLGALFEAILQGFRGAPAAQLGDLRRSVDAKIRSNDQMLEAARHEPSGGHGVMEGLSLLAQFARSLSDALAALELAVQGSHNDRFAQQLEPALDRLALDIHAGFHYSANCIYNWRFDIPPSGLHLEDDIAQLEIKMAEVRHTGISFSQNDILRAYAVQLHLKQLARLLRSLRIQTSRTISEMKES